MPQHLPLLQNETIEFELTPHLLAFYQHFLIWLVLIIVSLTLPAFSSTVIKIFVPKNINIPTTLINTLLGGVGLSKYSGILNATNAEQAIIPSLWLYFLIIFGAGVSVLTIDFKWLLKFFVIAAISSLLGVFLFRSLPTIPLTGALLGLLGFASVELMRRTHSFVVTNFRLILQSNGLSLSRRELFFSKISDMAVEQSLVGKIFNFGTLIPVTNSGLGLGDDFAMASASYQSGNVGVGIAGGKMVSTPRGRSSQVLFGVPDPLTIQTRLTELIQANSEVNHLQNIENTLNKDSHE